jgi:hypothetical protein
MKEEIMITTDYWNDEINFDKEFIIYQSLCNSLPKRKKKKLKDEFKFVRYATWKTYVEDKCQKYEYVQLIELSRYLNHQIRDADRLNTIMGLIFIPFIVSLISSVVFQVLNKQTPNIDIVNILNQLPTSSTPLNRVFIIVVLIILIILLGLFVMIAPIIFILIMFYIAKVNTILALKKSFYEDYKEIIDLLIRRLKRKKLAV